MSTPLVVRASPRGPSKPGTGTHREDATMTDSGESMDASRRQLLRYGALVSGAAVFGGLATASDGGLLGDDDETTDTETPDGDDETTDTETTDDDDEDDEDDHDDAEDEHDDLVDAIRGHGHYAWFPGDPETWARSSEPTEMSSDDMQWLIQPTTGGGVRSRIENLPEDRNAGFDIHLGGLGELAEVEIGSRTVETQSGTGPATLFIGLYVDRNDDGDFFEWESGEGPTEAFAGLGGDEEGVAFAGANGTYVIDDDTTFALIHAETQATVGELKTGAIEGIDADTDVGLYVGVASTGGGVEEVVVEDVAVTRR